jgi:Raf kinase inhibitor-like YbhB/YbcL family protein
MNFAIDSKSFSNSKQHILKKRYLCNDNKHRGDNINPALSWSRVTDAFSYAIIVEDLDAHNYIHWFIPYINPRITSIEECISIKKRLKKLSKKIDYKRIEDYSKFNMIMGFNHHNTYGYFGPCAPSGTGTHRYQFTIFALSSVFKTDDGKTGGADDFRNQCAIQSINILDKSSFIVEYNKDI